MNTQQSWNGQRAAGYIVAVLFAARALRRCLRADEHTHRPTNAGKSAAASAGRLRLQVVCGLLCLASATANAQSSSMSVDLNRNSFIPLADPYCSPDTPAFLGEGAQFVSDSDKRCTGVTVSGIPGAISGLTNFRGIVDWVLIELRETSGDAGSAGRDTVIARKSAFLLSNGRVVDAEDYAGLDSPDPDNCTIDDAGNLLGSNACPDVEFEVSVNENLYVVVRHRNHLGVMSAVPVVGDSGGVYMYDFGVNVERAVGGSRGQKDFISSGLNRQAAGVAMMAVGDLDGNEIVQPSDIVGLSSSLRDDGYVTADLNLDGRVGLEDVATFGRGNLFRASNIPR